MCAKDTSQTQRRYQSAATCLDFFEAVHRRRVDPLMYCHLTLEAPLECARLKHAVAQTRSVVPEVFCVYDFRRNAFVDEGFTAEAMVFSGAPPVRWRLDRRPQLQIYMNGRSLSIGMSHLLADGRGFLQYLYLLAFFYRMPYAMWSPQNVRTPAPVIVAARVQRPTMQTCRWRHWRMPPLRPRSTGKTALCVRERLTLPEFQRLHDKARRVHVTLNDALLAAYAQVIARQKGLRTVVLPCPADLRPYHAAAGEMLTIANMTGLFRRVTIDMAASHSFSDTLQQVQLEMGLQKSHQRCFEGLKTLQRLYCFLPTPVLAAIVQVNHCPAVVSYSNIGCIDHEKLTFGEVGVAQCYLTGSYRRPPDFQLTVSTFRQTCTLVSTLIGTPADGALAQQVLRRVKMTLMDWAAT